MLIPLPKPPKITRTTPFLTQTCRLPFQKQPALQTFKVQAAFFVQSGFTSSPTVQAAALSQQPLRRLNAPMHGFFKHGIAAQIAVGELQARMVAA